MHAFRIACFRHRGGIARDVAQAMEKRGAEGFFRASQSGVQFHPSRFMRGGAAAFERAHAAFGFALE